MKNFGPVLFNFHNNNVRVLLINDQPWFVASDISNSLNYLSAKDMVRNLDDDEKDRHIVPTLGGHQEMLIINESGLYSSILRSRKPEAKLFKKWVTNEVLPSIRKTGKYEHPKYQPEAHEKFSSKDTQNLARIIALMTQNFRFKQAWNNAIWYALREVTGIPSPYPMEVRLVPSIASECERIWHVTEELQDVIADAEKTAIKRIIRKRENADRVITEIETLLSQTTQDNQLMLNGALSNWHKAELTHFLQRC
ncbi:BRO-N domain-containing protein [Arsenophonus apicola]|jgi:prophage antirepressor-like protein|uniref:BRO family protein n=1 Tax=Arsenophonus apicola TaxID=2879119 RepID=A0ABY8P6A2_9GAMM|nr:BRO family protein [Arsenophonus apicola]WGO82344.1 BRO family protein [Arsenophonus apicola]WGO84546.1 BRO family protein [Arsenophonus apicola]